MVVVVELDPSMRSTRSVSALIHHFRLLIHVCQQMLPPTSGPAQDDTRGFLAAYIHLREPEGIEGPT